MKIKKLKIPIFILMFLKLKRTLKVLDWFENAVKNSEGFECRENFKLIIVKKILREIEKKKRFLLIFSFLL